MRIDEVGPKTQLTDVKDIRRKPSKKRHGSYTPEEIQASYKQYIKDIEDTLKRLGLNKAIVQIGEIQMPNDKRVSMSHAFVKIEEEEFYSKIKITKSENNFLEEIKRNISVFAAIPSSISLYKEEPEKLS